MIHVALQPEPSFFDERVRVPGLRFLAKTPNPTQGQWRRHSYWTKCLKQLHEEYSGICAYSCHWIPYDTGWRQVEHFKAKSVFPMEAYEWSNYRLVCGVLNGRKGTQTVLDPFFIQNGWFRIDFPSLLVKAAPDLDTELSAVIQRTIKVLGLNDEDTCLKTRAKYIESYCRGAIDFPYLQEEAPFIAMELERQGLEEGIREIMIYS